MFQADAFDHADLANLLAALYTNLAELAVNVKAQS
jgi:hypothetical protein